MEFYCLFFRPQPSLKSFFRYILPKLLYIPVFHCLEYFEYMNVSQIEFINFSNALRIPFIGSYVIFGLHIVNT